MMSQFKFKFQQISEKHLHFMNNKNNINTVITSAGPKILGKKGKGETKFLGGEGSKKI
jgi:hypothetical protein